MAGVKRNEGEEKRGLKISKRGKIEKGEKRGKGIEWAG